MINVTKSYLPDFEEYSKVLKKAWEKSWLTNNGVLSQELESKISNYLGVNNTIYVNNGTIALQLAIKTLDKNKDEIITTPFSYVATTNAILWEGFKPIFCDINSKNYCIDENKIENLITKKTSAILATHVFGNPCNIEKIETIGKKYNLKIIYDGAHAFGTIYKENSLLSYGDISICSFHATKIFHTVEGGCVITNSSEDFKKINLF
ncbi:MAG: aminotransferase DegT, partial [Crocinitomicaceae bacterium]|nr:aminotransferase DegT [Crocinitomicaceae bacterium]